MCLCATILLFECMFWCCIGTKVLLSKLNLVEEVCMSHWWTLGCVLILSFKQIIDCWSSARLVHNGIFIGLAGRWAVMQILKWLLLWAYVNIHNASNLDDGIIPSMNDLMLSSTGIDRIFIMWELKNSILFEFTSQMSLNMARIQVLRCVGILFTWWFSCKLIYMLMMLLLLDQIHGINLSYGYHVLIMSRSVRI